MLQHTDRARHLREALPLRRRQRPGASPTRSWFVAFAALTAICAAGSARADVTIVSQMEQKAAANPMEGAGASKPRTATETCFYKGDRSRVEMLNSVMLWDAKTGNLTRLEPRDKTYSVINVRSMTSSGFAAMLHTDVTATVAPTGATKTIAGRPTREYAYTAKITMTAKTPSGSAGSPPTGAPKSFGTFVVSGSEWVTSTIKLPPGGSQPMLNAVTRSIPGLKALSDKLAQIPGVPLATTQTVTLTSAMPGLTPPSGPGGKMVITSVRTQALSIRESALPDSLFAIPAGYTAAKQSGSGVPGGPPNLP